MRVCAGCASLDDDLSFGSVRQPAKPVRYQQWGWPTRRVGWLTERHLRPPFAVFVSMMMILHCKTRQTKNNTQTLTYKFVWVQMLQTSWAHIHKLMRVHPGSIVRVSDATVNIIQYALSMLLPPTGGCVREFRCTPNTNRFAGVCVWVGACVRACWRVRMSSNLSGIAITYCTALHAHTHIHTVCT